MVESVRLLKVDDEGNEIEQVISVGDTEEVGSILHSLITVKEIEVISETPFFLIAYNLWFPSENPPTEFGFLIQTDGLESAKDYASTWERECNNLDWNVEVMGVHRINSLDDLKDYPQVYTSPP